MSPTDIVLQIWQNGRDLYLNFAGISSLRPSYRNEPPLKQEQLQQFALRKVL